MSAYDSAYYQAHKNEATAYRESHRDEKLAYNVAYRESHKREAAAYRAAYYQAHREEELAHQAAYRASHPGYSAAYYQENKEERRAHGAAYYRENRVALLEKRAKEFAEFTEWLQILRTVSGCEDCGTHEGFLEHHHVDPSTKLYNVSHMYHHSLDALEAEMEKCVVLCVPCHNKRHVTMRHEGKVPA